MPPGGAGVGDFLPGPSEIPAGASHFIKNYSIRCAYRPAVEGASSKARIMLKRTVKRHTPAESPDTEAATSPAQTDFSHAVARFRAEVHGYIAQIDMRITMVGRALRETEAHHRRLRARRGALEDRKAHMTRLLAMCGGAPAGEQAETATASAHK